MRTLRIHHRLIIFLLAALALTCVFSPWMALGADWFTAEWPEILPDRVPFDRVFNRAFMVSGMILFIAHRRIFSPAEFKRLLSPGFHIALRNFFTGWGLAVLSIALLVVAMVAADVFRPHIRVSFAAGLSRFFGAFSAGLFAGALEEIFFRGILFLGIREAGHGVRAYVLANLLFAMIHFVRPGEEYFLDGVDLLAGFRHLLTTFEPFLDPLALFPGMLGLFLIGAVLSYALTRTGNLWLSIGLHAGWVLSLKMIKVFGNFNRTDLGWAFGATEPKIVSGVATWMGVLLVGAALTLITRRPAQAASDQPHATAA